MRFRGLPPDLSIGCLDVRLDRALMASLLPCRFCKFFTCIYFVCSEGHVTCPDCCPADSQNSNESDKRAPCYGCGRWVVLNRVEVPMAHLREVSFTCPCGFQGNLQLLRQHLKESELTGKCLLISKTPAQLDMTHFKFKLLNLHKFYKKVDEIESDLACLFDNQLVKRNRQLDSHSECLHYAHIIARKLRETQDLAQEVDLMNREMRPTLELLFRGDVWCVVKVDEILAKRQLDVPTIIEDVPLFIRLKQSVHRNKSWLGFFISGAYKPPVPPQRMRFPLKSNVIARLHSNKGHEIKKISIKTFNIDHFTSPSFNNQSTDHPKFVGVERFVLRELLSSPEIVKDGKICFSVQFEPLYDL